MLAYENYTESHINDFRIKTGADPSILERTVFALAFKVGNCLLLLLKELRSCSKTLKNETVCQSH